MNVRGKSSKQVKEALSELRTSFANLKRQLKLAREERNSHKREIAQLKREKGVLERRIERGKESRLVGISRTKAKKNEILREVRQEVRDRDKGIIRLKDKIGDLRYRALVHRQVKFLRKRRVQELTEELRETKEELRKTTSKLNTLKNRPRPKPRVIRRYRTRKVPSVKIVRKPYPMKLRKLMHENTLTQNRLELALMAYIMLDFSVKTKLNYRQLVILLEAANLPYFRNGEILSANYTALKELEYKGIVQGDRRDAGKALGWFLTAKGKRVAEMLIKKIGNHKKLKAEYLKYDTK